MIKNLKNIINGKFLIAQRNWFGGVWPTPPLNTNFTKFVEMFPDRDSMYRSMHAYFYRRLPLSVKKHRVFFSEGGRGYGEDALHAMWYALFSQYKPVKCLEIGVYRGQVISLWALLAKENNYFCDVHGISPFSPLGDEVSAYLKNINYYEDVLKNHDEFNLPKPSLLRALSTDSAAIEYIQATTWDLIYIDGSHDYDVVLSDYEYSYKNLAKGGILVIDDSSLNTDFSPPKFAFAGHPGPSRIVADRAMSEMKFLGSVGHNNVFQKKSDL